MPKTKQSKPNPFITPLYMEGLQGRWLCMPPPTGTNRELLIIYGQHASLESMLAVAEAFNAVVGVTIPDLPGFGGMDCLYNIGKTPTIDALADYLAAVIKLRYRNRRFTIAGVSFGFLVVTRMLERYPNIAKKVDLVISIGGLAHHDELTLSKPRRLVGKYKARLFSHRLPALFYRSTILHPMLIRRLHNRRRQSVPKRKKAWVEAHTKLLRQNDVRTQMAAMLEILSVDNCQHQVDVPLHHLAIKEDGYVDNHVVEQHMRVIYRDVTVVPVAFKRGKLETVMTKRSAQALLPLRLKKALAG